jgi:hypothetical protein
MIILANVGHNFKMRNILLLILLFGCKVNNNHKGTMIGSSDTLTYINKIENTWEIKEIQDSKLFFKNNKVLDTRLHLLDYIGYIPVANKDPYFIFSGVDCDSCDANISIYIYSPSDGELKVGDGESTYSYPGREYYYINDSLIYEARAFFGQVFQNKIGVVWYQRTLMDNGKWKNSIFFADVSGHSKVNTFMTDNGQFQETLLLLKKGLCKEIEGHDYTSAP